MLPTIAYRWLPSAFVLLTLTACNLEVTTSPGGRVVSESYGIDCYDNEGTCSATDYQQGFKQNPDTAFLSAFADDGYQFAGWQGNCVSVQYNDCYVNLQQDAQVQALFTPITAASTAAPDHTVRFVALGDFGEGNTTQRFVSEAMEAECEAAGGCQFAIGLGDNIYDENPTSTYSGAFETKFELPYLNLDFPFFMSLGNHDNDLVIDGLGSFNHAGDIQVAYTLREDKLSNKWQMPDRYYQFSAPLNAADPLVDFFALDSNPMMAPLEIAPAYAVHTYKAIQADWLQQAFAQASAPWKIAYTHHPFLSNGQHGNAGLYDGVPPLEPLTKRIAGEVYRQWFQANVCGKVDLFIAGHDHELQFLKSVPECGNTLFIISGAGAKSRDFKNPQRNAVYWQQDNTPGFFMLTLQGNSLEVKAYTVDQFNGSTQLAYHSQLARRQ